MAYRDADRDRYGRHYSDDQDLYSRDFERDRYRREGSRRSQYETGRSGYGRDEEDRWGSYIREGSDFQRGLSGGRLRREFDDSSFTRGRNYAQRDAERRESSRYDQNRDLSYGRDTSYDRDTSFGQSSPGWPRRYDEEELFGRDYTGRQQHRRIPITGEDEDRGWWERTSDAVASWFGDEEAERRRRMDKMEGGYRGRGPKGYRRSDERIREDINDRLSDNDYLDAYDIEVVVSNGEVVLSGVVRDRYSKRIAEDVTEQVSGVTNVENRLRLKQDQMTITGEGGESREGTTSSATAAKIGK